jgi:hypothetical protein
MKVSKKSPAKFASGGYLARASAFHTCLAACLPSKARPALLQGTLQGTFRFTISPIPRRFAPRVRPLAPLHETPGIYSHCPPT